MLLLMRKRWFVLLGLIAGAGFAALVYRASCDLTVPAQSVPAHPVVLNMVHTEQPEIALTFDDGPDPQNTPAVLKILQSYGAHATFFVLGSQVQHYPGLTERIAQDGNELGDHSMSHHSLRKLPPERLTYELRSTADLIKELSGRSPHFVRPPYGYYNSLVVQTAEKMHMQIALWTIDTRDWSGRSAQAIASCVLSQLKPGEIVLLHDGGGPRQRTIHALSTILSGLKLRGYRAVTLSELLEDAQRKAVQTPANHAATQRSGKKPPAARPPVAPGVKSVPARTIKGLRRPAPASLGAQATARRANQNWLCRMLHGPGA